MLNTYNHGQKSWGNLQFPERFPIHTGPTPPFTPQTILDVCIEEGEEELEKISKRMHFFMREPRNDRNI